MLLRLVFCAFIANFSAVFAALAQTASPTTTRINAVSMSEVTIDMSGFCGFWRIAPETSRGASYEFDWADSHCRTQQKDGETYFIGSCQMTLPDGIYVIDIHNVHGVENRVYLPSIGVAFSLDRQRDGSDFGKSFSVIGEDDGAITLVPNLTKVHVSSNGYRGSVQFLELDNELEACAQPPNTPQSIIAHGKQTLSLSSSIDIDIIQNGGKFAASSHSAAVHVEKSSPQQLKIGLRTVEVTVTPEWQQSGLTWQFSDIAMPKQTKAASEFLVPAGAYQITIRKGSKTVATLPFSLRGHCELDKHLHVISDIGRFDIQADCRTASLAKP